MRDADSASVATRFLSKDRTRGLEVFTTSSSRRLTGVPRLANARRVSASSREARLHSDRAATVKPATAVKSGRASVLGLKELYKSAFASVWSRRIVLALSIAIERAANAVTANAAPPARAIPALPFEFRFNLIVSDPFQFVLVHVD